VECIKILAANDVRRPDSEHGWLTFLKNWWVIKYERPLKDPLLSEYTLQELIYEYFMHEERAKYIEECKNEEDDKIEEDKIQKAMDWADEEERKELETQKTKTDGINAVPIDPRLDPDNIKWMENQLTMAKQQFGESFDIVEGFDDE
jgi:hypothetical protein